MESAKPLLCGVEMDSNERCCLNGSVRVHSNQLHGSVRNGRASDISVSKQNQFHKWFYQLTTWTFETSALDGASFTFLVTVILAFFTLFSKFSSRHFVFFLLVRNRCLAASPKLAGRKLIQYHSCRQPENSNVVSCKRNASTCFRRCHVTDNTGDIAKSSDDQLEMKDLKVAGIRYGG
jgi:hypothetical protein